VDRAPWRFQLIRHNCQNSHASDKLYLCRPFTRNLLLCSGIGIVNAIEVVNAFPGPDGLSKFKEWLDSPDEALFAAAHKNAKAREKRKQAKNKASAKVDSDNEDRPIASLATNTITNNQPTKEEAEALLATVKSEAELALAVQEAENRAPQEEDEVTVRQKAFMAKHRNVSKNWTIPSSFPDRAVVNAYIKPRVDTSEEKFEWGRPDAEALHKFCFERVSIECLLQRQACVLIPVQGQAFPKPLRLNLD
jgi:DNA excision repair protein ERCC-5